MKYCININKLFQTLLSPVLFCLLFNETLKWVVCSKTEILLKSCYWIRDVKEHNEEDNKTISMLYKISLTIEVPSIRHFPSYYHYCIIELIWRVKSLKHANKNKKTTLWKAWWDDRAFGTLRTTDGTVFDEEVILMQIMMKTSKWWEDKWSNISMI